MSLAYIVDKDSRLALLDVDRGTATVLMTSTATLLDIAATPEGVIYGVDADTLYRLDPDTGATIEIGPLGLVVSFIKPALNSLAWDPAGGRLIGAAGTTDLIASIDPATGAATVIANTVFAYPEGDVEVVDGRILMSADTHEIVSIGFDGQMEPILQHKLFGVWGLALLADGRLVGFDAPMDVSRAWEFDLSTGAVKPLADMSGLGLGAVFGAAPVPGMTLITGTEGPDFLAGDDRPNEILALGGDDTIIGAGGIDQIFGGDGNDLIYGNAGGDLIESQAGNDTVYAGQGRDVVSGGTGADVLYGNIASDTLHGEDGADLLYGGRGGDILSGGAGDDTLIGNKGDDMLTGQDGADCFLFAGDFGHDRIGDFQPGADRVLIALDGGAGALDALIAAAAMNGDALRIAVTETATIDFAGLAPGQLTAADFLVI